MGIINKKTEDRQIKELLNSKYRKKMWENSNAVIKILENKMKISEIHVIGSFTTKKRRPADVDFIILLKTKNNKSSNWSADIAVVPDNKYGKWMLSDAKKWMKQKYGPKNYTSIRLK